jgi:hypothetical protein
MWKTFGRSRTCSIMDCGAKSTKRLDLGIVGTQKFGAFGKEEPWKEAIGVVHIAVCDRCYKEIHEKDPDAIFRLRPTKSFVEHLTGFVMKSWAAMKDELLDEDSFIYGVVSDLAGRNCEQPGECGKTMAYCLPCRARHAIDEREKAKANE